MAKRRAILSGDICGLVFVKSSGDAVDRFELARWNPDDTGGETLLGEAVEVSPGVSARSVHPHLRFTYEGVPVHGGVSVEFDGPHRRWSIWRPPGTGALRISVADLP